MGNSERDTYIYILNFVVVCYVVLDLANSAIIGNANSNRTIVYVLLGVMIGLTAGRVVISRIIHPSSIGASFFYIWMWILVRNVLFGDINWQGIIHIFLSLLWLSIFAFYRYYITKNANAYFKIEKFLRIIVYLYIIATILAVFRVRAVSTRSGSVVLSTSYYVLVFLPVVLACRNKRYKYITIFLMVASIFLTFKRGAIVALVLMVMVFTYCRGVVYGGSGNLVKAVIMVGALVLALLAFDNIVGGQILSRFTIDSLVDGSGRNTIYNNAIDVFRDSNIVHKLFGNGSNATNEFLYHAAHNEWLEFLIDYGLMGCALYLLLVVRCLKKLRYLIRIRSRRAPFWGCTVAFFLSVGMYGAVYFVQSTIFLFTILSIYSVENVEEYLE